MTTPVITNECVESPVGELDAINPTSEKISDVETETTSTSEIISEVPNEPEEEDDYPEGTITPGPQTVFLINNVIAVASEWKPLHKKLKTLIDEHRTEIVLLKDKFGVRQGCAGRPMLVGKVAMMWEEFVVFYFDVSAKRINQLLDMQDDKSNLLVTKPRDNEKSLYKKGYAAAVAEAEAKMAVASTEEPRPADEHSSHKPQWCVKTPDGHDNFQARAAIQKEIRRCLPDEAVLDSLRGEIKSCNEADETVPDGVLQQHEQNACYWIAQLYHAGCDVWRKLIGMMHEDIGIADMSVWDEIRKLEQDAKRIKDNKYHPDLLVVFNAVLVLCRARKSRAADNIAIHLRTTNWRPRPVSQADIEVADEAAKIKREVPDYAIDKHTAMGRAMGRDLDFFLEEGSKLGNLATDVREVFSPDYRKGYIAGYAGVLADNSDTGPAAPSPTPESHEITLLKEQIADLQHQNVTLAVMVDNQTAAPALRSLLEEDAAKLREDLAVEPDRDKASGLLSTYLANVAKTFENDHIIVKRAWAAAVTFSDRDNRIMPGDFLERRKLSAKPEDKSTLAKCVEVREFMSRPRVQEWVDGKWEKGHILCNGEDFQYTVIREYVAKLLEPGAFGEPNSPTPSPEPPSSPEPRSTPEPQPSEQLPESQLPVPEPGSETVLKEAPATNPTNAVDKEGTTPPGTAPQLAANHVKAANAEAASKPRRKAGLAADATIKHEPVPNGGPRDSETRLPPSKIVYTTFRGGPVVREYPCGSSSSWEPPTTKYAVCIGTESQIFSKVDEAKASCDKAAERLAQKPRGEERNQNAALA